MLHSINANFGLISLIIGVLFSLAAVGISIFFNWKANRLAVDLSGFIIQEITKNPDYVYPFRGKDGKLHKGVLATLKGEVTFSGSVTAVKNAEKRSDS